MSEGTQINSLSWELALLAVLKDKGGIKVYSTAQVRKIIASALSENNIMEVQRLKMKYNPAPPPHKKADQARFEIQAKRDQNNVFTNGVLQILEKYDKPELQQLMQYTLWNVKLLEDKDAVKNGADYSQRLELLLECEGVNKKPIMSRIKTLLESRQSPRKNDRNDTRRLHNNDRRY